MYTLLCCADICGSKVNLEVTLDGPPGSVKSLEQQLEKVFLLETQAISGKVPPKPFRIVYVSIYDDIKLDWTALKRIDQVHEYDQLYVFQPQSETCQDLQQDLPPPRPPLRSRASSAVAGLIPYAPTPASTRRSSYSVSFLQESLIPDRPTLLHEAPFTSADAEPRPTVPATPQHMVVASDGRPSGSPFVGQIQSIDREQTSLVQRLRQLKGERDALAHSATKAAEEDLKLQAQETNRLIREKEEEIWRQREVLRRAQREFHELMQTKQNIMNAPQTPFFSM